MANRPSDAAWEFIRVKLFHPGTNLFYDYLTSREHEHRFDHLPTAEEIARSVPNPCGWGTGMEDCMLNAGSVMEILVLREKRQPSPENRAFAARVLEGMALCAEVHGVSGFVARGVSPRDGKSCYINSSRDQFTLFVYGLWRYLHSTLPEEAGRRRAAGLLVKTAEYCEKTVTPENNWNLLRLDGHPALVSKLWECHLHEVMRLPMFYAAAWEASGDEHWRDLALRYARPGIAVNLTLDPAAPWWDIELVQMQLSLALLRDALPELRGEILRAMELTHQAALREFDKKAIEFTGNTGVLNASWRKLPLKYRDDPEGLLESTVLHEGYPYAVAQFPSEFRDAADRLRAIGNLGIALFLVSPERSEAFETLFERPDYANLADDGAVNLLHAKELLNHLKSSGRFPNNG